MLKTILSISGKPGLYKLISQGKNMLIVETIDAAKKRFPAYGNEKIISLADIAMYTNDSEVPLRDVLRSIKEKVMVLPDDTKVYPGHGEGTSVGYERENNPFLVN